MIEAYAVCDKCGKREQIEIGGSEYCGWELPYPRGWRETSDWTEDGFPISDRSLHLCDSCSALRSAAIKKRELWQKEAVKGYPNRKGQRQRSGPSERS